MSNYHTPVLIQETLDALKIVPGGQYIDATLGGGGHAREIVERGGIVLGIDVDREALDFVEKKFKVQNSPLRKGFVGQANFKLKLARGNFRDIDEIALKSGFDQVKGILFDIGVSSHQIDVGARGFSFQQDAPLDMRMDQTQGVSAKELVNTLGKWELTELFQKLGEERKAKVIADRIVKVRERKPIETTGELAFLIQQTYGIRGYVEPKKRADMNKRVFQALRIAVNDELNAISIALPKALSILQEEGRIAVITFHSLEEKIVTFVFEDLERNHQGFVVNRNPISATAEEIHRNPRSRSAKLQIFEKGTL